jgi:hypothetical protein
MTLPGFMGQAVVSVDELAAERARDPRHSHVRYRPQNGERRSGGHRLRLSDAPAHSPSPERAP